MRMTKHNPATVGTVPHGYSHGVEVSGTGRILYISGQVGVGADGQTVADYPDQVRTALKNFLAVLDAAGMDASNIVKMNIFVTPEADTGIYGRTHAEMLGDITPAVTLVTVVKLGDPLWRVEIEGVAVG
ncbi:RidA family protein [Sphingosinicella microcystinivorans]|uniref:Enamine deaminase RidA n=1 Tax=Sphingosinicella microcystinivorans TaxID=335406 RepID=A0AAD1D4H4_SPHMI|nr:RidA family protein [Sphingosinicella microcystinivorans]RKS85421.1 enamine deaminase RidA (YjgF/YER057c/UK114 family) [Sphingosinicella microcystinivorans]BBE33289.1 enamine deaminase RidA [Sphingosinicella microcystinivorans]